MLDPGQENSNRQTDIAALSAAAAAVVVAMFLVPGNFDLMGAVISLTLLFLICGYIWRHSRVWQESLGIAAVIALLLLPVFGFVFELSEAENPEH